MMYYIFLVAWTYVWRSDGNVVGMEILPCLEVYWRADASDGERKEVHLANRLLSLKKGSLSHEEYLSKSKYLCDCLAIIRSPNWLCKHSCLAWTRTQNIKIFKLPC